ncbi:CRISPR-associated protein Cas5 [Nocardia sp. NBC_01388]|uniref:CRISPR-associated protein Cas5 n=1 Tax=Nocardia sp. NBC_01388 TaxID=2903596 RepID=UPI003869B030
MSWVRYRHGDHGRSWSVPGLSTALGLLGFRESCCGLVPVTGAYVNHARLGDQLHRQWR